MNTHEIKGYLGRRLSLGIGIAAYLTLIMYIVAPLLPEQSFVARGAALARKTDCLSCHGQPTNQVPNDAEIDCATTNAYSEHLQYNGSCRDVLAYFEAVRLKRSFQARASAKNPNELLRGEILARQYHCFNCHGELGQGGMQNAGAFKGYIPGYFGDDFQALTKNGNSVSVRAWITQGLDPDLVDSSIKGRVAKYFIENQEIEMPVFASIPKHDIRTLVRYVLTLHELGEMDARMIRMYSVRTQSAATQ